MSRLLISDLKTVFVIAFVLAATVLSWTVRVWLSPTKTLDELPPVFDANRQQDIEDFERNFALWKSLKIKNYSLTQEGDCWVCPSPQETEVLDGKLLAAYLNLGEGKKGKLSESHLGTIDELFAEIQRAINDKAEDISVEYDSSLGYPTKVMINYKANTADDECSHKIRELKIIQ